MTVQPVGVYTPYQPTIAKNKQIKKKKKFHFKLKKIKSKRIKINKPRWNLLTLTGETRTATEIYLLFLRQGCIKAVHYRRQLGPGQCLELCSFHWLQPAAPAKERERKKNGINGQVQSSQASGHLGLFFFCWCFAASSYLGFFNPPSPGLFTLWIRFTICTALIVVRYFNI